MPSAADAGQLVSEPPAPEVPRVIAASFDDPEGDFDTFGEEPDLDGPPEPWPEESPEIDSMPTVRQSKKRSKPLPEPGGFDSTQRVFHNLLATKFARVRQHGTASSLAADHG